MRLSSLIHGIFVVILLVSSGWIVSYYWQVHTLEAIRVLPTYVMVLSLVYVLSQIIKRLLSKNRFWWDWLYYIGLLSAMLPTFIATVENESIFHLITDIGTPFLTIPVLFDLYQLIKNKK